MSSIEFEELEELIKQKYEHPDTQHLKFDQLENDPNSYAQHQELLEKSFNFAVLVYCSNYLDRLLRQDDPICNVELFKEIFNWIPQLFNNRIDLFFQMDSQARTVVTDNLIKLFVYILSQLWEPNSKIGYFFDVVSELIPDEDFPHREIRYLFFKKVITRIAEDELMIKIQTQIIVDRNDKSLFELFKEVVELNFSQEYDPSNPDHVGMVQEILDLLLAILNFYNKKKKESSQEDESDDFLCDLTIDFRDILEDENFINRLFSFFDFSMGDVINYNISASIFSILYEILSLKHSYYSTTIESNLKGKLSIIGPIVLKLTQLLEMNIASDQKAFYQMSFVINRMSNFFEEKMVAEIQDLFVNFLAILRDSLEPYLTECDMFINNNVSIVNLMKFWSSIVLKNSSIGQINEMASPVFHSYINALINSSQEYPEDVVNILDLDKYIICDTIQIIPGLLKSNFGALGVELESSARQVFEIYTSIIIDQKDSPEDLKQLEICDIQMSLFILIMTSGLRNSSSNYFTNYARGQPDDFEITFFKFIMEVIEFTDQNIQVIFQTNTVLLEQSLYVFARSFRRTVFAQINAVDDEEKKDILDYFNRIIKRLIDALYGMHIFYQNHSIAFNNLLSIENLYDYLDTYTKNNPKNDGNSEESVPLCFMIDATNELIESAAGGLFEFAKNTDICQYFKSEIKLLSKIVRSIVTKNDEFIQPYLTSIEEKFSSLSSQSDFGAIFIFIYELIGIFSNDVGITDRKNESITSSTVSKSPALPSQNNTFIEFFEWVFPKELGQFVEIADQVATNVVVISPYLKFWYVFMSQVTIHQKNGSIFPKHSPNAIILFTMIANVVNSYFEVSSKADVVEDTYKEKLKPLKYVMLLMSESMSTDYIMYGAFELYEDTTLVNLITNYIETIENYDLDLIFNFPKVAIAFMKLSNALCKNHLNTIVERSPPFFDYLFRVITVGLTSINEDIANISIEAGTNMGFFLQANKFSIEDAIERNRDIICQIATIGFDIYISKNKFKLIDMIGLFLTVLPDYLASLAEEMGKQVSEQDSQEYNNIFQELIQAMSESYLNKIFNSAMQKLKKFADKIHLKVPIL